MKPIKLALSTFNDELLASWLWTLISGHWFMSHRDGNNHVKHQPQIKGIKTIKRISKSRNVFKKDQIKNNYWNINPAFDSKTAASIP